MHFVYCASCTKIDQPKGEFLCKVPKFKNFLLYIQLCKMSDRSAVWSQLSIQFQAVCTIRHMRENCVNNSKSYRQLKNIGGNCIYNLRRAFEVDIRGHAWARRRISHLYRVRVFKGTPQPFQLILYNTGFSVLLLCNGVRILSKHLYYLYISHNLYNMVSNP